MADYPGREDEHDLGSGCSFVWLYAGTADSWRDGEQRPPGQLVGLIEHHPAASPDYLYCGAYIMWTGKLIGGGDPRHRLVSGGPGDEGNLTIEPSLLCRTCGHHGFIRDGRWVAA